MLTSLLVKNFAIISNSEIEFQSGMTTVTGETGAGKSILLKALNNLFGERIDRTSLQNNEETEICACFDLQNIPIATQWLTDQELLHDDPTTCILRRKIKSDGKSKNYVNGSPVTLNQLKELAPLLASLYSQHAHYALFKKEVQLERLDTYSNHNKLLDAVNSAAQTYQSMHKKLNHLQALSEQEATQKTLLEYQYQEIEQLALSENEIEHLEEEHHNLITAESQIQAIQNAILQLDENDNSLSEQLYSIHQNLSKHTSTTNATELLSSAHIQIKEAQSELYSLLDKLEVNPERLAYVEQRLTECHDIARKHKVHPEELYQHGQSLSESLSNFNNNEQELNKLRRQLDQANEDYCQLASELSKSRKDNAAKFASEIQNQLQRLNLPESQFEIRFTQSDSISTHGWDQCDYYISLNKGQSLNPLEKVASGGELSRIGLAIQVISSQKIAPPTIVFDEVDVGISGATAEVVGQLLKKLSKNAQVICITHQAQVAAQAHHHLHVHKTHGEKNTTSTVSTLTEPERIKEIANIVGGVEITAQTLSHAKEMFKKLQKTSV